MQSQESLHFDYYYDCCGHCHPIIPPEIACDGFGSGNGHIRPCRLQSCERGKVSHWRQL